MVGVADLGRDGNIAGTGEPRVAGSGHSMHCDGHPTFLWCFGTFLLATSASVAYIFAKNCDNFDATSELSTAELTFVERC